MAGNQSHLSSTVANSWHSPNSFDFLFYREEYRSTNKTKQRRQALFYKVFEYGIRRKYRCRGITALVAYDPAQRHECATGITMIFPNSTHQLLASGTKKKRGPRILQPPCLLHNPMQSPYLLSSISLWELPIRTSVHGHTAHDLGKPS